MKANGVLLGFAVLLAGCGTGVGPGAAGPAISSVTPSSAGYPNSVTAVWPYEFVSVQGTGQIFTYDISSGVQVQVGLPYATPCTSPSGMVVSSVAGSEVMAVPCYDTGELLTLTVHGDGSLSELGKVGGLGVPYSGIAVDGTNVFVPVFGVSGVANGGVAKVNIASPAAPVLTAFATLASPFAGATANPDFVAVSGGNIFVVAGSESGPQDQSSTIQVVNEATMSLVGRPLVVAHSPQHLAVKGNAIFVTFFDAAQLESIDVSSPADLKVLQVFSLTTPVDNCPALPILVQGNDAFIGCYYSGMIERFDISNPSDMKVRYEIKGIAYPQELTLAGGYLLVTDSSKGGRVYQIDTGAALGGKVQ